jgi:hypothetical protein
MTVDETTNRPPVCAQVFDRLVEGADAREPELAEHLGSCMSCFRALTELRDAPRLGALLRADPLPLPVSDAFWNDLAARTTDAAAAALADPSAAAAAEAEAASPVPPPPPARRSPAPASPRLWARPRRVAVMGFATAVAAAAGFMLVVARRPVRFPSAVGPTPVADVIRGYPDDDGGEVADVTDLDRAALRRLLDRLGAGTPAVLTASAGGDAADGSDAYLDDDAQVNDELAELDGPALLRVARSLRRDSL